jgi:hypothetical protein
MVCQQTTAGQWTAMPDTTACLMCGTMLQSNWHIAGHMPPLGILQSKTLPGSGRRLYELTHHNVAPIAEEGLKQIAALYRIESHVRGQSAEERLAMRQQKSVPKMATFKIWLDHARTQVSAKTPTGQALKYIAKYWDGLILFLTDGCIEMDSNAPSHRNYVSTAGQWWTAQSAPSLCKERTRSSPVTMIAHKTGPCSRICVRRVDVQKYASLCGAAF